MTGLRSRVVLLYDRAHPELGGMERMIAEVAEALGPTDDVTVMAEQRKGLPVRQQVKGVSVVRHRMWEHRAMRETFAGAALVLGFGYTPYSLRAVFTLSAGVQALKAGVPLAWCPTYYPMPQAKRAHPIRRPLSVLGSARRICRAALASSYHTLFHRCRILFALTDQERLHWLEFSGVPVEVLPHGVSSKHAACTTRASARAALANRYGPGPHVVTIGRITAQKNQQVVVRALARIKRHVPGIRLLVVGPPEGPEAAHLRELSEVGECSEAVTFTGAVAEYELCELYAGASCVVHPSRYEASGLVPLEALAHGTPVIHSGGGALRRYVGLPGALSVSAAGEPDDWVRAIESTLADLSLWDSRAALGRGHVFGEHTWERTAAVISGFAKGQNVVYSTNADPDLAQPAFHGASSGSQ